jgi:nucleoside 2-deoxyribosyltransferase
MAHSFYLAARYPQKDKIREYASQLRKAGFEVTSSWLRERFSPSVTLDQVSERDKAKFASRDVADILEADALIAFFDSGLARPGHNTEFGVAIGAGKHIITVGPPEDIFFYLPGVLHFPDWPSCLEFLTLHK